MDHKPNYLRECRLYRGMSQWDVAQKLGLKGTGLISRWEHGNSLPSLMNAIELSKLYQVPIEGLFAQLVRSGAEPL